MPFTLCHPALVIPLNGCARRMTSLAALVIGSMAPDFVYFVPLGANGGFSHSVPGILLYCVPAGALVYLVYHALLRDAFVEWAPRSVAARMQPDVPWLPRDARAVAVMLTSFAIGAASHIGWDAFTHADTIVVRHLDVLRSPISIGGHAVPLFKVLQHTSSLVGFLLIASYAARWFSSTTPSLPACRGLSTGLRWMVLATVGASAGAGAAAGLLFRSAGSVERMLFNMVVTGMATAGLVVVLLCVWRRVSGVRRSS